MQLATSYEQIARPELNAARGLKAYFEKGIRPAVGFSYPLEVVKDPHLTPGEKREILCSWASDASAVRDQPTMRWLLGTPEPVPLDEVREALLRLEASRPGDGFLKRPRRRSSPMRTPAAQVGAARRKNTNPDPLKSPD